MNSLVRVVVEVNKYIMNLELDPQTKIIEIIQYIREGECLISNFCSNEQIMVYRSTTRLKNETKISQISNTRNTLHLTLKQPQEVKSNIAALVGRSSGEKIDIKNMNNILIKALKDIRSGAELKREKLKLPKGVIDQLQLTSKFIYKSKQLMFNLIDTLANHLIEPQIMMRNLKQLFRAITYQWKEQQNYLEESMIKIQHKINELKQTISLQPMKISGIDDFKVKKSHLIWQKFDQRLTQINSFFIKNVEEHFQKPIQIKSMFYDDGNSDQNPLQKIKRQTNIIGLFQTQASFFGVCLISSAHGFLFDINQEEFYSSKGEKKVWKNSLIQFKVGQCFSLLRRTSKNAAKLIQLNQPLSDYFDGVNLSFEKLTRSKEKEVQLLSYQFLTFRLDQ